MEKFLTRLKYYGIGFAIGLVFVFIFFQNRGCSWLPSNRVKNSILDRVIFISDSEKENFDKLNIDQKKILMFLENGKVLFNESKKDGFLQVYVISLNSKKLYFLMPKDSYISEVKLSTNNVYQTKLSETGYGKAIHFPNEKNLIYADSLSFKNCFEKENYLSNNIKILKLLKNNGKVNLQKSKYYASPRATICWNFTDKLDSLEINSFWYKNKINIFSINGKLFKECN